MKVASSGSRRTTSSASIRMRAQTGSTLSRAVVALAWCWAMTVSGKYRSTVGTAALLAGAARPGMIYGQAAARPMGPAAQNRRLQPPGQERRHPLLEHLVADREHMVAPGDIERPAGRQHGCQLMGGAGDRVLAADRDQHRHMDRSHLLA